MADTAVSAVKSVAVDDLSSYGWVLGPAIGAIGVVTAWWRNRGLRGELRDTRTELREAREEQREELRSVVGSVVAAITPALPQTADASESESGMDPSDFVAYVGFTDVTNDGRAELLVMHPAGVHASILKVFGSRDTYSGFEELGEVFSGIAGGFDVGDFDGDGLTEIATVNADFDRAPDRSFADAVLVENFYGWNGVDFEHVGEGTIFDPRSGTAPERMKELFGRPKWALTAPPGPS
jgi:hypothetical protein